MAKKFGKFLLFTAAVGTAAAAVYYFVQKKNSVLSQDEDDEDYDDFSDKTEDTDVSSRTYVPLNHDASDTEEETDLSAEEEEAGSSDTKNDFTPLSEQVAQAEETVEEFFDEADSDE